jgi:hypothetical protein
LELIKDFADATCADRAATFADGEAHRGFHGLNLIED